MENSSTLVREFNLSIFHFINKLFGQPIFDNALTVINAIGEPYYFQYHLLTIAIISFVLIYRKKNHQTPLKELLILGVAA